MGQGGAAAGSDVAPPQLQPEIGRLAEGISLQFDGETVNSKDEAKLNALPTEPSAALIASVRDLCAAKTMQQKESALRTIYEVAALAYGYPVEVF